LPPHTHGDCCGSALSRRVFLRGSAAAAALPLAGCDQLDFTWLADLLVPPEVADELGARSFAQIVGTEPVLRDAGVQRRVAAVAGRVIDASGSGADNWQIVVFDRAEPNAFALPGGKIGVFSGMLRVAQNDDQLATVLGHEVAHVEARHGAQRIVAGHAIALILRLATALIAGSDVPVPPELVIALGGGLADLGLVKPFSRSQELAADKLGLSYMAKAGFDPGQAVAFWQRMQRLAGPGRPPVFLSAHPSSASRIELLRQEIDRIQGATVGQGM
jgi:predicted Zn-dependent protease